LEGPTSKEREREGRGGDERGEEGRRGKGRGGEGKGHEPPPTIWRKFTPMSFRGTVFIGPPCIYTRHGGLSRK